MSTHSAGLLLIWKIAAIEAQNLRHQEINPVDLMLGLLKIVDLEPGKLTRNLKPDCLHELHDEVTQIKQIFINSGLFPAKTRRRLRRESFHNVHNVDYKDGVIHRSFISKKIFKNAEKHLLPNENAIKPLHLLVALLNKQDADLERALLLVSFPVSSVKQEIAKKIPPSEELKHPSLPPPSNHTTGSEYLMRHCRAAIGYIELSMFIEAEEELNKIDQTEQVHPVVMRLREDIRQERP
jgi:ATP-dependent Clp protease ATP-binding subunit ClpA